MSVELKESAQHTAPTAGAVVRLKFDTEGGGRPVIMRAKTADGAPVPFGARVTDASGQEVGTVAQAGRIVLHGIKGDTGVFSVTWGEGGNQQCKLSYALPTAPDRKAVTWTVVDSVCGS